MLGLAIAQDVTHILTQEALDALAELLNPIDILLHHAVLAVGVAWPRGEGADTFVLLVVPGNITGQIKRKMKLLTFHENRIITTG